MRYEVRNGDARLIGLWNGPDRLPQNHVVFASMEPLGPGIAGDAPLVPDSLKIRNVRLDVVPGAAVPTLVLASGKRSWLNRVRGFRRI